MKAIYAALAATALLLSAACAGKVNTGDDRDSRLGRMVTELNDASTLDSLRRVNPSLEGFSAELRGDTIKGRFTFAPQVDLSLVDSVMAKQLEAAMAENFASMIENEGIDADGVIVNIELADARGNLLSFTLK